MTRRIVVFLLIPEDAPENDASAVAAVWTAGLTRREEARPFADLADALAAGETLDLFRVHRVGEGRKAHWQGIVERLRRSDRPVDCGVLTRNLRSPPLGADVYRVVHPFLSSDVKVDGDADGRVFLSRTEWRGSWVCVFEDDLKEIDDDGTSSARVG